MARKVFFSFHYERDIWRAGPVRNSWVTKPNNTDAGFWDKASWEAVMKKDDEAIKKWIRAQMDGTSVTVVLIGAETSDRKWVKFEVQESHDEGKGMLGIHIHNIKDKDGKADTKGTTYFGSLGKDENGKDIYFGNLYSVYDWVDNNGYNNLGTWVEKAATNAGR